ncbi:MAG: Fe-S oxidoreductase [Gammaproteobacteria bacterium]|nr:MAG: Fe-S oxidoreductase [Gammaproteobacteria bacterium]
MSSREGSLEAPTRHALEWRDPKFYDGSALEAELERVFDICHGCRRCFSLCNAFPTLFEAVDASAHGEVAGLERRVFWQVVDHCYLCDMCFMTKCPYVPPHPWNVDFPHLMLRAKAVRARTAGLTLRERALAATDTVGRLAGIPVVAQLVNAVNRTAGGRALLEKTLGVDRTAPLPQYHARSARRRLAHLGTTARAAAAPEASAAQATAATSGRVALFTTCYGNRNEPALAEDLVAVFAHNGIEITLLAQERCCGMPRLELGDLRSVARLKEFNIPPLARAVEGMFDPFEYLMLRHEAGLLRTDFKAPLGKVSYHVPCHLRVQNLGLKTRDLMRLVPGTSVDTIERCSGHNGTYGVKHEFRAASVRIGRAVVQRVESAQADHYASDCPMAAQQIASGLGQPRAPEHPLRLLRIAYGLT